MVALIAGATGLVGRCLVEELLRNSYYDKVMVLVRRKDSFSHQQVQEIVFNYDNSEELKDTVDDVFICLGTTIKKAGSQEAFRKVDYEYVCNIASLAEKLEASSLQVISSSGAKHTSRNFYLRTKGLMENEISKKNIRSISLLRPSLILGDRNEFRFGESLGKAIIKPFTSLMNGNLLKYKPIEASKIALAMFLLAKSGKNGVQVIENESIHKIKSMC